MGTVIGDGNGWLILLAFVLGLVLTFAVMLRRAQREVPADATADAEPAGGATSFAGGRSGAESDPAMPEPTEKRGDEAD